MSQFDFGNLISPLPGADFIDNKLEPWRDALHSMHMGPSRPSYAIPGLMWVDNSGSTWVLKMFQGSSDIVLGAVNQTTLEFTTSSQLFYNTFASTNPTPGDDELDGFRPGSIWINLTTTEVFMAVSVNTAAAVWILISGNVPSGSVIDYAGPNAPFGYLFPYGQLLLRADYPTLFNAIGTTHGSTSAANFRCPDYRGVVSIGRDDMGGTARLLITQAISGIIGTTLGFFGGDQRMHKHGHTVNDPGHSHEVRNYAGIQNPIGQNINSAVGGQGANRTGNSTTGITIADAGEGTSQNVQPSIVMNKIIRI